MCVCVCVKFVCFVWICFCFVFVCRESPLFAFFCGLTCVLFLFVGKFVCFVCLWFCFWFIFVCQEYRFFFCGLACVWFLFVGKVVFCDFACVWSSVYAVCPCLVLSAFIFNWVFVSPRRIFTFLRVGLIVPLFFWCLRAFASSFIFIFDGMREG